MLYRERADHTRPAQVDAFLAPALTSLIDRDGDIERLTSLLASPEVRLVTLVGPGGVGKTRLVLAVADLRRQEGEDPVHTVPLAQADGPGELMRAIARTVGSGSHSAGDDLDEVIWSIGDDPVLLVLDNLEHLLDDVPLLVRLLLACPRLTVLGTSRAALRLTGEHLFEVRPLAIPALDRMPPLDELRLFPAVRLFVDRARSVAPDFALTMGNAADVARICHQLDGLPLAIELAAAQGAILPPAALLDHIASHLTFPVDGPRDAPEHRRTLRGMLDWSYNLLSPRDQRVFRSAGVFAGSFGADALAAVDTWAGRDEKAWQAEDALPALGRLVGHSLLGSTPRGETPRFSMLNTVRRYALDRLEETPVASRLRDAHARWYLDVAEQALMESYSPGAEITLLRLDHERANMLAALHWLKRSGDTERLVRLATALSGYWLERAAYREGAEWLSAVLEIADQAPPQLRARASVALGLFLSFTTHPTIAASRIEEGLAILQQEGDAESIVLARIWQGSVALRSGDATAAEKSFLAAIKATDEVEDQGTAAALRARALSNLGIAEHERGDSARARTHLLTALETCEAHGYRQGMIRAHRDLGDVHRDLAEFSEALSRYQASLSLMTDDGDIRVIMNALSGTALALASWEQPERAALLLGAATEIARELGAYALLPSDQRAYRRAAAIIRTMMSPQDIERAMDAGRQMLITEVINTVLAARPLAEPDLSSPPAVQLSAREEEVLRMVAEGLSDREIAARLYLSVRTVEAHVLRIRNRFGVKSRTAAVTAAIARGLIEPGDMSSPGARLST